MEWVTFQPGSVLMTFDQQILFEIIIKHFIVFAAIISIQNKKERKKEKEVESGSIKT